jgi:hypothetical protein
MLKNGVSFMKRLLLALLAIGGITFLAFGYMSWQDKTSISSTNNQRSDSEETKVEGESNSEKTFYSNWPEEAQADYKEAKENGEAYKVAIVGSTALGKGENGWSEQVKGELLETGSGTVEVEIFQFDTISIDFIYGTDMGEVVDYAPDMVLYEPFSLNDNSVGVLVQDNHDSIEIFLRNLKEANEDVVLLLQPTHPLFGATYYPLQVEDLKAFAEEKGFTYLDHWEAWPEDESLNDLVSEGKDVPNEEGHKLWADYLTDYFIAE